MISFVVCRRYFSLSAIHTLRPRKYCGSSSVVYFVIADNSSYECPNKLLGLIIMMAAKEKLGKLLVLGNC